MRRLFRLLVSAFSVALLVAVVLGYFGHIVFELDIFAHFRLHFFLLCAPAVFFALAMKDWAASWRVLFSAVLAIAGLGALWESGERAGGEVEIVIMAANLYQNNRDPDAMKDALLTAGADVLVTMETTKATLNGPNSLALRYPYRLSLSTTGQVLRTVIWSKFPMRDGKLLLEDQVEPTGAYALVEYSAGQEFSILGLHLAHNLVGNQKVQIEALDRISEGLPRPLVVVGDLNATAWSHAVRRVGALTSTQRVGGFRITWKGSYPTPFGNLAAPLGLQLDHAFVSDEIGVRDADSIKIPGSDHRAVLVRVALPAN